MNRVLLSFRSANLSAAVAILLLSALWLAATLDISGVGGEFPRWVATASLLIAALDIGLSWHRYAGNQLVLATDGDIRAQELAALLWPILFVLLIWVLGFLVAVPVFMPAFMAARGNVGVLPGMSATLGISAFLYVVFVELLGVRLYGGLLSPLALFN